MPEQTERITDAELRRVIADDLGVRGSRLAKALQADRAREAKNRLEWIEMLSAVGEEHMTRVMYGHKIDTLKARIEELEKKLSAAKSVDHSCPRADAWGMEGEYGR